MIVEATQSGMLYHWGLAGPEGAWFTLLPERGVDTQETIATAKRQLRDSRDVVKIWIAWRDKGEATS